MKSNSIIFHIEMMGYLLPEENFFFIYIQKWWLLYYDYFKILIYVSLLVKKIIKCLNMFSENKR